MGPRTLLLGIAVLMAAPGLVAAQPQSAPATPAREGFTIGASIGFGNIEFTELDSGSGTYNVDSGFFELHFGGLLKPRLALLVELWGTLADEEDPEAVNQRHAGLALQYWASSRFWIKGGLGSSRIDDDWRTGAQRKGFAAFGALGYELITKTKYAIDLQLRLTAADYHHEFDELSTSSTSAQLGLSWY